MNVANATPVIRNIKNPWELSKAELKTISKSKLLKYWGTQIHLLWDRLPAHLRADPEVALYLPCMEHWNTPDMRTHIDGPAPRRWQCEKCHSKVVIHASSES